MLDFDEEYIGESARTFGERLREFLRALSHIYDHVSTTGHHTRVDSFSILVWVEHNIARNIEEAMYIKVNDPSLNKTIGKFQLSHIWDEVLFNTLTSISGNPFYNSSCPLHIACSPMMGRCSWGLTACVNISQYWVGMWSCMENSVPYHLALGVTLCTSNGAVCGKYNIVKYYIFDRPDEAMLFFMLEACLHLQNILLLRTLKEHTFITIGFKQNETLSSTWLSLS